MLDVTGLAELGAGQAIDALPKEEMKLVQRGLNGACYKAGPVDGLIGSRTRTAFADFVEAMGGGDPACLTSSAAQSLSARTKAWEPVLAKPAGGEDEVKAALVAACRIAGLTLPAQIAYVLATAEHETAGTYRPVREAFWLSDGGVAHRAQLEYAPYYGRGYVQLTWKRNYELYGSILGLDLVDNPDEALRHDVSLFVIVHGMKTAGFTSHRLEDYINETKTDRRNARRVINGIDRADDIAALAQALEVGLA